MKNNKAFKITVLSIAGMLGAAYVFAGEKIEGKDANNWEGKHMERMAKELKLTPEQQEQVKKLKDENKADRERARNEYDEKFQSILNDEQKAKYKELKAKRMEKREKHEKRDKQEKEKKS